jgi:hypothetical protein
MAAWLMAGLWAEPMQQRLMSPDLIHVAAANENSGRVVLVMPREQPNALAIDTALHLARAFEASLEALLIECPGAVALTEHSFARQISYTGRIGALSSDDLALSQTGLSRTVENVVHARVAGCGVNLVVQRVRAPAHEAILAACQSQGPWNMIVLGEAMRALPSERLRGVLADTPGATGVVVVGAELSHSQGDVIVLVEEIERFGQLVRAAQRLAGALAAGNASIGAVRVLLAATTPAEVDELEGLVRLALPTGQAPGGVEIVIDEYRTTFGTHAEIAEAVRRLDGAFVVARHGGAILPRDGEADALSAVLRAPLLLVR